MIMTNDKAGLFTSLRTNNLYRKLNTECPVRLRSGHFFYVGQAKINGGLYAFFVCALHPVRRGNSRADQPDSEVISCT